MPITLAWEAEAGRWWVPDQCGIVWPHFKNQPTRGTARIKKKEYHMECSELELDPNSVSRQKWKDVKLRIHHLNPHQFFQQVPKDRWEEQAVVIFTPEQLRQTMSVAITMQCRPIIVCLRTCPQFNTFCFFALKGGSKLPGNPQTISALLYANDFPFVL